MEARLHHYDFAHKVLPNHFFQDPVAFMNLVRSPIMESWILHLWNEIGTGIFNSGQGLKVDHKELKISRKEVDRYECLLITLPTPEKFAEAFFIGVVVSKPPFEYYSYFVLEKCWDLNNQTEDKDLLGVLCEWFSDGGRRNHLWYLPADLQEFYLSVLEMIKREEIRFQSGLPQTSKPFWIPAKNEKPVILDQQAEFRIQHCLFSFFHIPVLLSTSLDYFISSFVQVCVSTYANKIDYNSVVDKSAQHQIPLLEEIWLIAGEDAVSLGKTGNLSSKGLCGELVVLSSIHCVLITLPEPISAPESYFLLIPIHEYFRGNNKDFRIYSLELPKPRYRNEAIVVKIDPEESFTMLGKINNCSRRSFLMSMEDYFNGKPFTDTNGPSEHLQLRVQVSEAMYDFKEDDDTLYEGDKF